jgi:hypothetical protein
MKGKAMRKALRPAAAFSAAMIACLALSGCPVQPTYPSTITPIYAATLAGGLFVYNGAAWTNYTNANTGTGLKSTALNSVVVTGSGSGAVVLAGGNAGVSRFDGAAWSQLTTGLGAPTSVNRLFVGSNIYAATSSGLAILNGDGTTWTNNGSVTPVNDVFAVGTYTLVAGGGTVSPAGFYEYNGTGLVGGAAVSPGTIVGGSGSVTAVYADSLGDLIVGTNRGLAVQLAGSSSWTSLLPGTPSVSLIAVDSSGYLYAATSAGLYKVGSSAVLVLPSAALSVCVDGAGMVYAGLGANQGLSVSSNGGSSWTPEPSLAGQTVTAVTTTAPLYSF